MTLHPPCAQIIVTEVGDETFIIAAIMAMRHPRIVVYAGAMTALFCMTVRCRARPAAARVTASPPAASPAPARLQRAGARARQIISTALGVVLPNLISRKATHHAASVLYIIFGARLLWIAWRSKPQDSNQARAAPARAHAGSHAPVQRLAAAAPAVVRGASYVARPCLRAPRRRSARTRCLAAALRADTRQRRG